MMKEVSVGILLRNGSVLTGQRKHTTRYPLKWEFPGGKLEHGESPREALIRELEEELGIDASPGAEFFRQEWDYGDLSYRIFYFLVPEFTGEPENRTFAQIKWVTVEELLLMDILDGNREVVELLVEERKKAEGRRNKESGAEAVKREA